MSDETTNAPLGEADGPEIDRLARERRLSRGLKLAARRALVLARRYRDEEGPRGQREAACVAQALAWRTASRNLRAQPSGELGPGLARARPGEPQVGAGAHGPDSRRVG